MPDNRRMARRIGPLGAIAAAGILAAGLLGAGHLATRPDPSPGPGAQPAFALVSPPAPGVLPLGESAAPTARTGAVLVGTGPVSVHYTFDAGVGHPVTDTTGGHELRVLGQNGGRLSLVPQGLGLAVAFPQRCQLPHERDCPRAILEGERDDTLNPGTRPLRYGASVLMSRADLADGANVLQKGYSVGGVSQFKLQVDHQLGHPSCVVVGQGRIYRAEPALNVADGSWHELTCERSAARLTIMVDGVERASVPVPRTLSIANAEPLRVGGKGPNKGNDQYAGQIDNVFLEIP
ncbi:concanavalin A-like lectin/glucanase superfamily protein [Krasilnikovia cinnamomea]|uniref:Concanavalin A-like lectin/glucanase superfamily protein n=1 Tax=Krasilnikovia cinnamomea TaxID=349313 RepID=A0A4Q7ZJ97_9ACTN|nr:LamG-like jellyroll fold domain-containing protein [Krasilnikovia cinnamomea]RZU50950.1 concanavalin A-like lectin/glucanase superfamily protein [Krasilnikovia cinnamomea]